MRNKMNHFLKTVIAVVTTFVLLFSTQLSSFAIHVESPYKYNDNYEIYSLTQWKPKGQITIPSKATGIKSNAFSNQYKGFFFKRKKVDVSRITTVVIPDSVKFIEKNAFTSDCSSLKNIVVQNRKSKINIAKGAFPSVASVTYTVEEPTTTQPSTTQAPKPTNPPVTAPSTTKSPSTTKPKKPVMTTKPIRPAPTEESEKPIITKNSIITSESKSKSKPEKKSKVTNKSEKKLKVPQLSKNKSIITTTKPMKQVEEVLDEDVPLASSTSDKIMESADWNSIINATPKKAGTTEKQQKSRGNSTVANCAVGASVAVVGVTTVVLTYLKFKK